MTMHVNNPEAVARVMQMKKEGHTGQSISLATGISKSTVARILRINGQGMVKVIIDGVERQVGAVVTNPAVRARVERLYLEGMTQYQVADAVGCAGSTVGLILREMGYYRGQKLDRSGGNIKKPDEMPCRREMTICYHGRNCCSGAKCPAAAAAKRKGERNEH
jgi:uncharacterized protein YerC